MAEYRILYLSRSNEDSPVMLRLLWRKIERDSLTKILFHDGSIKTEDEFVEHMTRGTNAPFLVVNESRFAFFTWLNDQEGHMMRMHFTMFKDSWGEKRNATAIARHVLEYVLTRRDSVGYLIDTVVGLTPVSNRLACRFILRAGMQKIGILPNAITSFYENDRAEDGLLTYATRDTLGLTPAEAVEAVWNV